MQYNYNKKILILRYITIYQNDKIWNSKMTKYGIRFLLN